MKFFPLLILLLVSCTSAPTGDLKDGDLVFQRSQTRQDVAVAAATHSKYTHVGIIFFDNGSPYVYEAVQPVRKTPFKEWIQRGQGHYTVRRVKDLDIHLLPKVRSEVGKMLGKDYDWLFDWSDSRIYCSELVWKAYDRAAGIQIGKLRKLKDFDLTHETVQKILKERYGNKIPKDMKVISPGDMFDSKLLITVRKE